ncbi:MAG: non-hydrolyzing UDP-N-acetylglucosamine 2-epimerase [Syntrophobacteraceae bacterium]
MKIIHVVGARPNFMKVAPVMAALAECANVSQVLVHTGQHYDANMSRIFFEELGLPKPDVNLEVGSGSHAMQTAQIMMRFEEVVLAQKPDMVLVYGDVNSTVASAVVCSKLGVSIGHVEAGLRSFDRTMPEEINRLLTDQIADLLFTPSKDGDENLLREGIAPEKIHLVGNVMIDTLIRLLPVAAARPFNGDMKVGPKSYGLITLHRPSNVDDPAGLKSIMEVLMDVSKDLPLVFPVHPRTRSRIAELDLSISGNGRMHLVEPLGYLDFLKLQTEAAVVVTDSGGIQEETTYLGVPCLTVRENTERPITVEMGTNVLIGRDMLSLRREFAQVFNGGAKQGHVPPLWDGRAGERIAAVIAGG